MPIQTYFIYVPLRDANTGLETEWEWLPVLLPWEMVFLLNTHGELPSLIGDASPCLYWQEFLKQTDTAAHPIHACSDTTDVIPVHWHVDGVEVTKSSGGPTSNYVFSWSSALVTGPSLKTKFLLTHVPSWRTLPLTNDIIISFMSWFQTVMMSGRAPRHGYYGEPLYADDWDIATIGKTSTSTASASATSTSTASASTASASTASASTASASASTASASASTTSTSTTSRMWRFYFAGFKSDLAERLSQHGHSRNHLSNSICDLDLACKHYGPLFYGDCRRCARWRDTAIMHADYLLGSTKTIWNGMPGFSIWRHVFDLMHILYSNGVANDFSGAMLVHLCFEGRFPGSCIEEQLGAAFLEYREWARLNKGDTHRYKPFTPARLGLTTGDPHLSGLYKCGQVRSMTLWVCAVGAQSGHRLWALACTSFSNFVNALNDKGPILSDERRYHAHRAGVAFLDCYQALWNVQDSEFHLRPKMHYLDHIISGLQRSALNPNYFAVWQEEDFMGRMKDIIKPCHTCTVQRRSLQRYIELLVDMFAPVWRARAGAQGSAGVEQRKLPPRLNMQRC